MGSHVRELLTVCLNPAWQKTLVFRQLTLGAVNRAESLREAGGGKGINAARAIRIMEEPAAVALFCGGHTGELLRQELQAAGIRALQTDVAAPTRTCTTLVDLATGAVTELIEPSGAVPAAQVEDLLGQVLEALPGAAGVALCGTAPPGVPPQVYGRIAAAARGLGVPVVLDTVKDVGPALAAGVDVLKVNAAELRALTGVPELPAAIGRCLRQHAVRWVAVTDGPATAWLGGPGTLLRYDLPRLDAVRSTIGAGDCATGVLLARLAVSGSLQADLPAAYADALAAASASCLTDVPSLFDPVRARDLRQRLTWRAAGGSA